MQGRGSEPLNAGGNVQNPRVAPHAGAWIGTTAAPSASSGQGRRPSCRGVDWNKDKEKARRVGDRRPSCRGVDWNPKDKSRDESDEKSPLMQGRGLEHPKIRQFRAEAVSPLMQGRGLELN